MPRPSCVAISRAIARWSPVTIFTATPNSRARSIVSFVSCRAGKNVQESGYKQRRGRARQSTKRHAAWRVLVCCAFRNAPHADQPRRRACGMQTKRR